MIFAYLVIFLRVVYAFNKQGINDQAYIDQHGLASNPSILQQRYNNINMNFNPGVHIYNLFWSGLEVDSIVSSSTPTLNCPSGSYMVPSNEDERIQKGYKKYRCIDQSQVSHFRYLFSLDQQYGIEPAVVMWCANKNYINQGCTSDNGNCACAPRQDALDDWSDYVNVLVQEIGYIKHYIVWNENAAGEWFSMYPIINIYQGTISDADLNTWVQTYASMFTAASNVIGNSGKTYVSTDGLWDTPVTPVGAPYHIGTHKFLDKFWELMNNTIAWYLAVHPYREVYDQNMYSMITLTNVSSYQNTQIMKYYGVSINDVWNYEQAYMAASEQGWDSNTHTQSQRLFNLCKFHEFAASHTFIMWVTHLQLQRTNENDMAGFILDINDQVLSNPSGDNAYKVWQAMNDWDNPTNYCCSTFNIGWSC